MKKSLQTLGLLLVALLPVTMSARDILGDVNHDDRVNISDVTSLISILLNSDAETSGNPNADTNRDGVITIADVTELINYLLGDVDLNPSVTARVAPSRWVRPPSRATNMNLMSCRPIR